DRGLPPTAADRDRPRQDAGTEQDDLPNRAGAGRADAALPETTPGRRLRTGRPRGPVRTRTRNRPRALRAPARGRAARRSHPLHPPRRDRRDLAGGAAAARRPGPGPPLRAGYLGTERGRRAAAWDRPLVRALDALDVVSRERPHYRSW